LAQPDAILVRLRSVHLLAARAYGTIADQAEVSPDNDEHYAFRLAPSDAILATMVGSACRICTSDTYFLKAA